MNKRKHVGELTKSLFISSMLFLMLDITLSNMLKWFCIMSCSDIKGNHNEKSV